MKIACITSFAPDSFDPTGLVRRIGDEYVLRGCSYEFVAPEKLNADDYDAFVHALDRNDENGWAVVERLRAAGRPVLRPVRKPNDDKVAMAQAFTAAGLPFPRSFAAYDIASAQVAVQQLGYPCVGKGRYGSQGKVVRWIEDEAALEAFIAFAHTIDPHFILQEVVYPLGRAVRAFVVGDKVVAAMERFAVPGDFRANFALSGDAVATTLTEDEVKVSLAAAQLYDTPYGGVDFARTATGPVLFEINKVPAVKGIESVTGVNVCSAIVDYFERQFDKH